MYCNFTVPIASIPGKVVIMKKKYVLLVTGYTYDEIKKYTVPERVTIGRVCKEDPSLMYPNENFLKIFPGFKVPAERSQSVRSCCLKIGSYLVIKALVKEQRIREILEKRLNGNSGLFLDLMSYFIVEEDNAGQYFPNYAFNHPLFTSEMRIYSDSKVSRFFKECTQDQIIGFLDDWNSLQDHRQRIYISYDSSNKNCQAGDIDIVEFGHAKDDKNLPIFNFALAYDRTNQKPLFYEQYPGSICDVGQLKYLVDKVSAYKYKHIGFVLDRGYFSKGNIKYMDENKYQFIIMVKGCKPLVSSFIADRRGTFEEERSCHIKSTSVYGTTIAAPLFAGDKTRYFHLYYKPEKASSDRRHLEQTVDALEAALKESIGREVSIGGLFLHYFDLELDENNQLISFAEKSDVIKKELQMCGYFCIISSENISASDAYFLYKGRDSSEKLFRADKTFLGSRSLRVQSEESLSTKTWIEFAALIIRNRMYNLLKDEMLRLNVKKNFMTVPAAIKELNKIEMVRRNNGQYRLDHDITKNQKIILSSFGLSVDDVLAEAAIISETLAQAEKSKEINENLGEDDAETEIDEDAEYEDSEDEI